MAWSTDKPLLSAKDEAAMHMKEWFAKPEARLFSMQG
jgi:hypothetical protein